MRERDDIDMGVPPSQLSDAELERQGLQAHATRHWVFLHGTAEQYRTHTRRMLELEQEYLRRHPQRTWQGAGGVSTDPAPVARDAIIRDLLRTLTTEVSRLLDEISEGQAAASRSPSPPAPVGDEEARTQLLAAFAGAPGGRLHKLEAHQIARRLAPNARLVAALYRQDPPLLRADGDSRVITDEGRAWLASR
jgi:hypothetical protein